MRHVDRMIGVAPVVLGITACAAPQTTSLEAAVGSMGKPQTAIIVAASPPPAKRVEIPPPAPSAQALWDHGHWSWNGARYVWTPGRYIERPRPDANWLPGYWQQEAEGWVWVEGRWRS
jgi:hypothetical protein